MKSQASFCQTLLVLVEDKKAIMCTCYSVWDIFYNNLSALIYFHQQVALVYTVDQSQCIEPIFNTICWKDSTHQEASFPHHWSKVSTRAEYKNVNDWCVNYTH